MTLGLLSISWQVIVDAIGLGAVYALMAVGIGLVFGILRLVNFAYGQLVMAGAYALAFASQWELPLWLVSHSASPSWAHSRSSWTLSCFGHSARSRRQ